MSVLEININQLPNLHLSGILVGVTDIAAAQSVGSDITHNVPTSTYNVVSEKVTE